MEEENALILKSPIETALESLKTRAARLFSSEEPAEEESVTVELESSEPENIEQSIIKVSQIQNIDDFAQKFVQELQIQDQKKQEQLQNYIQEVVEQYFLVKEPDIQQYISNKIEKVLNNIVNIDKSVENYQNVIQKTIENVIQDNRIFKNYHEDVLNEFTRVAPEVVQETLTKIFNKTVNNNGVSVTKNNITETTVENIEQNIVQETPTAENVTIETTETSKLDTVNSKLVEEIPQNAGGSAYKEGSTEPSSYPSLPDFSSIPEPPSAPVNTQSSSLIRTHVTVEEPHTRFLSYPGFSGITELS